MDRTQAENRELSENPPYLRRPIIFSYDDIKKIEPATILVQALYQYVLILNS